MAKFSVYLPDALRERALAADLSMSELLRNAVIAELRALEQGVDAGDTSTPASS